MNLNEKRFRDFEIPWKPQFVDDLLSPPKKIRNFCKNLYTVCALHISTAISLSCFFFSNNFVMENLPPSIKKRFFLLFFFLSSVCKCLALSDIINRIALLKTFRKNLISHLLSVSWFGWFEIFFRHRDFFVIS